MEPHITGEALEMLDSEDQVKIQKIKQGLSWINVELKEMRDSKLILLGSCLKNQSILRTYSSLIDRERVEADKIPHSLEQLETIEISLEDELNGIGYSMIDIADAVSQLERIL